MSHKTVLISTRFTPVELEQIGTRSNLLGIKPSTFLRSSLSLYIEKNPEIPYQDFIAILGSGNGLAVEKNPTSFRLDEKLHRALQVYLITTKTKKSNLVRHAAVKACVESIEYLQSRPEFCSIVLTPPNFDSSALATKNRHSLATCRLEGSTLALLNKMAQAEGLSRSQFMEQALLSAMGLRSVFNPIALAE